MIWELGKFGDNSNLNEHERHKYTSHYNLLLSSKHIRATTLEAKRKIFSAYQFHLQTLEEAPRKKKSASMATICFQWLEITLLAHFTTLQEDFREAEKENFSAQSNKTFYHSSVI